jgi:hypothetical protein
MISLKRRSTRVAAVSTCDSDRCNRCGMLPVRDMTPTKIVTRFGSLHSPNEANLCTHFELELNNDAGHKQAANRCHGRRGGTI